MMPVVPFLCLTAGYGTTELGHWLAARTNRPALTPALITTLALLVLTPSAWSVVQFDRLISRTDNRLAAAGWLGKRLPNRATVAQLGPAGGHVFLQGNAGEQSRQFVPVDFDQKGPPPDVIIVQSSPLFPEQDDSGPVADILATKYVLGADLLVDRGDPRNVYDRQDEFYLPFAGFKAIERPGPNLKIYIRRQR